MNNQNSETRKAWTGYRHNSMAYKAEIGLHRGTVKLVTHNPKWAECFSQEKELLVKILGEKILDLRHIGSTSIPGILAKPILDILAAVKTLADVQAFTQDLNNVGDAHTALGAYHADERL